MTIYIIIYKAVLNNNISYSTTEVHVGISISDFSKQISPFPLNQQESAGGHKAAQHLKYTESLTDYTCTSIQQKSLLW